MPERKKTEQALRESYQQLRMSRRTAAPHPTGGPHRNLGTRRGDDELICSDEACEMLGFPVKGH